MAADDYPMGVLADESSYDPFAAEKFVPPAVADQTRLMAGKDVDTIKHVMGGLADMTTLPKRAIEKIGRAHV